VRRAGLQPRRGNGRCCPAACLWLSGCLAGKFGKHGRCCAATCLWPSSWQAWAWGGATAFKGGACSALCTTLPERTVGPNASSPPPFSTHSTPPCILNMETSIHQKFTKHSTHGGKLYQAFTKHLHMEASIHQAFKNGGKHSPRIHQAFTHGGKHSPSTCRVQHIWPGILIQHTRAHTHADTQTNTRTLTHTHMPHINTRTRLADAHAHTNPPRPAQAAAATTRPRRWPSL